MDIRNISFENRTDINDFISSHWFSTNMVVRGEIVDMTTLDGFIAYDGGTILVNRVIEISAKAECIKIKLITTNDNINAIRFYQKRGFDMVRIYHNAVEKARKLKPSIPMIGDNNIPLKHEIEFEMNLF